LVRVTERPQEPSYDHHHCIFAPLDSILTNSAIIKYWNFANLYKVRDTARFSGFRKYSAGKTPSLKKLVKEILGVEIQEGQHSSVEDARAAMLLFRRHKSAFDTEHARRFPTYAPGSGAKSKKKKKSKR